MAGGTGTRLSPLTKVINKHLLHIYNEPMIYKPIKTLTKAGITDIVIVLGGENVGEFIHLLGDGKEFGANFTYVYQREAGGIAQALNLTKHIIKNSKVAVILGDNIFEESLEEDVKDWDNKPYGCGCKLFLKEVNNPERFGVAELKDGKIINIEEKPKEPTTNLAVTGVYFYDENVFNYLEYQEDKIGYSKRGELEITDLNNIYLYKNLIYYKIIKGFWSDAGTFESLLKSNNFMSKKK